MLKKTITYENPFTKQQVSEDHYFHISKADLIELQMENLQEPEVTDSEGRKLEGFPAMLQRIVNDKNGKEIMVVVKDMIRRSYGKKEGDRFIRASTDPQVWTDFVSTEAYSQLYFELCTDAEKQADFINGIFPSDMVAEAQKLAEKQASANGENPPMGPRPAAAKPKAGEDRRKQEIAAATSDNPILLTRVEVTEMDSSDLQTGLASGKFKLS